MLRKPREYGVYDAFLAWRFPQGFTRLVVARATRPPLTFSNDSSQNIKKYVKKEIHGVQDDTLSNFERVWGRSVALELEHFRQAANIRFTKRTVRGPLESDDLRKIRADFPDGDGIVFLSCLGFSDDGRQALGAFDEWGHESFPNMGRGVFLLATQIDDAWRVTGEAESWIA